jgi:hypothetical protein
MAKTAPITDHRLSDADRRFIALTLRLIVSRDLAAFRKLSKSPVYSESVFLENVGFYNPSTADLPGDGIGDVELFRDDQDDNQFELVKVRLNPRPDDGLRLVVFFERAKDGGDIKYVNLGDEELEP